MPAPAKLVQARHYDAFHCIGADCEDTCCDGWGITIDRVTHGKYRECSDPELKPRLAELITISTSPANDDDYASFNLSETHCPFLSEGWCSIQKKLGEDYLSNTCAIYPRIMNLAGDALERSLDLSCPEAARIVLLASGPLEYEEAAVSIAAFRMGSPSLPDTPSPAYDGRPYPHYLEVRNLVVWILQERSYPLWKRLVIVGHLCDKLTEMVARGNDHDVPDLIPAYMQATSQHLFDEILSKCRAQPAAQLVTVLELVVNRITSDFTGRRFLNCYEEFMQGLEWTQESAMEQITGRYVDAYARYYAPFVNENQQIMERYLVNYVYKNLFPFGRLETNRKSGLHHIDNSICVQYVLMIVYYAVARTVLVGMAGFHKEAFGMDHVIKLIQSATKAFQHSTSFPARAIDILVNNGLKTGASMAVLVQDLSATDLSAV